MPRIEITKLDNATFDVIVHDTSTTTHTVTVPAGYAASIAPGSALETLVKISFEFLLERESNVSILRRFDLPVIGRYFPEYEREIHKRLN